MHTLYIAAVASMCILLAMVFFAIRSIRKESTPGESDMELDLIQSKALEKGRTSPRRMREIPVAQTIQKPENSSAASAIKPRPKGQASSTAMLLGIAVGASLVAMMLTQKRTEKID